MKKIILLLSAAALVVSCSHSRKWTDSDRDSIRKIVRDHRDRSAIRHMEAANYQNLEQCVVTTIEGTYPDYNRYDRLTGKTDTLDAVIVSCLGFTIGPNYENLPLLFPASQLQRAGILPAGMTDAQIDAFYACLTGKVKNLYKTPELFTIALFDELGVPAVLSDAMQQCVNSVMEATADAQAADAKAAGKQAAQGNDVKK